MSGFSKNQLKQLVANIDHRHVKNREVDGRTLDYIEGWFAMAEANRIFGFAGWDRETVELQRLFERQRSEGIRCGYVARVRVRVRAGSTLVVRDGTGFGDAFGPLPGEAYERAIKAAETDATKRALTTFGNRFGLSLYDKERRRVTPIDHDKGEGDIASRPLLPSVGNGVLVLVAANGETLAANLSAEGFCQGLRQLTEAAVSADEVQALKAGNWIALQRVRETAPQAKTSKGEHLCRHP